MGPEFADHLPENWERFSRLFSALGDTTRQQILPGFGPGEEIGVSNIARLFKISRPASPHHLKVPRNAEWLVCEKRGKEVYCHVNHVYCAEVMGIMHDFIVSRSMSATGPLPDLVAILHGRALDSLARCRGGDFIVACF